MSQKNKDNNDLFWCVLDIQYHYAILNKTLSELMMYVEFMQNELVALGRKDYDKKDELVSNLCNLRENILNCINELDEEENDFDEALKEIKQSLLKFELKINGDENYGI